MDECYKINQEMCVKLMGNDDILNDALFKQL